MFDCSLCPLFLLLLTSLQMLLLLFACLPGSKCHHGPIASKKQLAELLQALQSVPHPVPCCLSCSDSREGLKGFGERPRSKRAKERKWQEKKVTKWNGKKSKKARPPQKELWGEGNESRKKAEERKIPGHKPKR